MEKALISFVLVGLLTGCSVNSDVQRKVDQHDLILKAMTIYFADLQEKGVLPRPEQKKEEKK